MDRHKRIDLVKEIAWNLVVYVMYFLYCFVMLLIFHFLAYRFIKLDWSLKTIGVYALVVSTVMMAVRIVRLIKK